MLYNGKSTTRIKSVKYNTLYNLMNLEEFVCLILLKIKNKDLLS